MRAALGTLYHYLTRPRFSIEQHAGARNLNLGCGERPLAGFVNLDLANPKHADVVADLNGPLPFADGEFDLVYSDQVFEHIRELPDLMRECHRILRPGGRLVVRVPYFKTRYAFIDPTHVRFFTVQTLDYFVRGSWLRAAHPFFAEAYSGLEIHFDPERGSPVTRVLSAVAVKRPDWYEDTFLSAVYVMKNIVYVLTK